MRDEVAEGAEIERRVEGEPHGLDRVEPGSLELVEAPLENDVRYRTFDERANPRREGCRKHHGLGIGSRMGPLESPLRAA